MRLIFAFVLALVACDPVEYIADEAAASASRECQRIIDERTPILIDQAWQQCNDLYQNVILPTLDQKLDETAAALVAGFQQVLADVELEIMTRLGCFPVPTVIGWDCSESLICGI